MAMTAARARAQAKAARDVDRPADLYHAMGFLGLPVALELSKRAGAPFVYDARDLYAEGNNIARLSRPRPSGSRALPRSRSRPKTACRSMAGGEHRRPVAARSWC